MHYWWWVGITTRKWRISMQKREVGFQIWLKRREWRRMTDKISVPSSEDLVSDNQTDAVAASRNWVLCYQICRPLGTGYSLQLLLTLSCYISHRANVTCDECRPTPWVPHSLPNQLALTRIPSFLRSTQCAKISWLQHPSPTTPSLTPLSLRPPFYFFIFLFSLSC